MDWGKKAMNRWFGSRRVRSFRSNITTVNDVPMGRERYAMRKGVKDNTCS